MFMKLMRFLCFLTLAVFLTGCPPPPPRSGKGGGKKDRSETITMDQIRRRYPRGGGRTGGWSWQQNTFKTYRRREDLVV